MAPGRPGSRDDLDDTVSRIDRAGRRDRRRSAVGHTASAVAVGAAGVWVADTARRQGHAARSRHGGSHGHHPTSERAPTGIAVGAGAVWVANSVDGTVSRIDPRREPGGPHDRASVVALPTSPSPPGASGSQCRPERHALPPLPVRPCASSSRPDFNSTDPAQMASYGPQAAQLEFATCAKLLNYPDHRAPQGTRLVPEVAAAMPAVSPDGRTYRFTVRPGFRFSPPSGRAGHRMGLPARVRALSQSRRCTTQRASTSSSPTSCGYAAYHSGRARHLAGVSRDR